MAVRTRINVPLTEEFNLVNYDGYQTVLDVSGPLGMGRQIGLSPYNYSLSTQNHVDVRTFCDPDDTGSTPENWTTSSASTITLGPNATYNNWLTMSVTLSSGSTTFLSSAAALDLTSVGAQALLTLELPAFPTGSLTLASCFIDLISGTEVATMPFSAGYAANRLILPIADFTGIDFTSVDTVRLRFTATGSCTVTALALRLVDPNWTASNMDFDNWNGFYRQSIPQAASTSYYPLTSSQQIPAIWRAAESGATDDPQPINGAISVIFNTGTSSGRDFLVLNMRQVGGTDTSQLILGNLDQAQLDGPQPGLVATDELPRELGDIEGLTMGTLAGESMLDLTAVETQTTETWIQFALQWGSSPYAEIINTGSPDSGYRWDGLLLPALSANTYYMAVFTLIDTQARIQIYEVDQANFSTRISRATVTAPITTGAPITSIPASVTTNIPAGTIEVASGIHSQLFTTDGVLAGASAVPVHSETPMFGFPVGSSINVPVAGDTLLFDTGLISDSYQFIRRPGRFGWGAAFLDGDASIRSIRPQSLVFAEYRSAILASDTPVKGARLYAEFTPNTQMWQSFDPLVPSAIAAGGGASTGLYPSLNLFPSPGLYPEDSDYIGAINLSGPSIVPTVSLDFNRQLSGSSYKVFVSDASAPGQGLISNVLTPIADLLSGITDFADVEISLSIWFPSAAQNAGSTLAMFLLSEDGSVTPLGVPAIQPDHWQNITLYAPSDLQSGRYQLGIVYVGNVSATFWVDSVSVIERVVTWSARANQEDPWTDFRDIVNTDSGGVTFADRGTGLQLRAQAHQQAGAIFSYPNFIPIYAELGKFSYPENIVVDIFPTSNAGTFTESGSTVHPATVKFQAVTSYGALTAPLSASSSGVSSLTAHVSTTIPSNSSLTLSAPGVGSQTWFTAPGAASGASSIVVNTEAPTLNFPTGSVVGLFAPSWDIISYQWSFGDGGAAVGASTQHTFTTAGSFTVTLTMTDIYGGQSVVNATTVIT